jgi:hypothetical protein
LRLKRLAPAIGRNVRPPRDVAAIVTGETEGIRSEITGQQAAASIRAVMNGPSGRIHPYVS